MSRSAKKGPFVDEKVYKKVAKLNENRAKQPIKTWSRSCTIIPEFVGHTFEVHNGNKFIKVFVQEDMVGHKLGEFSPTRVFRGHSGRKTEGAPARRRPSDERDRGLIGRGRLERAARASGCWQ